MKVEYINPFILSTLNVFETMVGIKPEVGRPALKTSPARGKSFISGVIGLSGDLAGSVVLSFPKTLALKVVSAVLGIETKIIDDTVTDTIGELTNIVAGRAREKMKDVKTSISIPSVIVGADHVIHRPSVCPCVTIPFKIEWGEFSVDVSIKEVAKKGGTPQTNASAEVMGGAA